MAKWDALTRDWEGYITKDECESDEDGDEKRQSIYKQKVSPAKAKILQAAEEETFKRAADRSSFSYGKFRNEEQYLSVLSLWMNPAVMSEVFLAQYKRQLVVVDRSASESLFFNQQTRMKHSWNNLSDSDRRHGLLVVWTAPE